jgi:Acetyltransferase (GNAT) domain
MAVNPSYQRQGIGSMMMRRICEETDRHGRCAYVLAAPEGVCLYRKFGFKIVGRVQTPQGTITSMLRPSQECLWSQITRKCVWEKAWGWLISIRLSSLFYSVEARRICDGILGYFIKYSREKRDEKIKRLKEISINSVIFESPRRCGR